MKQLIWIALFILVALAAAGWGSDSWQRFSAVPAVSIDRTIHTSQNPSPSPLTAEKDAVNAPKIDASRLWKHAETLAGERVEERYRTFTRDYISQQLKTFGFSPKLQEFDRGINVFAERKGTDSKAGAILVAAHYDTVPQSPGADDNATGVAAVLEVARLLGSRPTLRTLQVAFFDREEIGLLGSLAFAGSEVRLKNLQGAIVLDMIGYACRTPGCQQYPEGLTAQPFLEASGVTSPDKGEFIAVIGDAEHPLLLRTFAESGNTDLPPVVALPVPLKGVLTPDVLRSDHAPFWYKGVGAVLVTDTANLRSPHYHQSTDTLANIDRPFFTGSAQIVVNAAAKLLEIR
ncbi:MAG: M20/M25/M40 family metallo-hydrolase [Microcoleus sp. PH2017_10_PVI_O_A]|uniref:M20/M25/M40 family metallo-hydrolase n=1 Tax=unclassified Microcoleus TaxID=2642155 RepID=UPI001DBFBF99|nr:MULTISPECIES: M20/M25/M40 family metallo-hydrolase [unclassified Microcoleus]TAE85050.1 MAG: M20/M25/M40 family metallo-hydrolase [Oscillatoriales cyanobacterium]MCC3404806.1 M20/M25/M40 family metallo-hydrolase [Microcoleus sp. PH2017_10_PVI_O_A]MCC3458913.1 M20/M25/M40 family metallo-hydrolase [Microcoleus sp. PH2017_11_PCY_U_A]MCC3477114.1 M20/M25/M40 family metallo-hydrolase [Microcoleus sp. PH2017_12_PCY_D_A]MCC3526718.1 M20/M25/M40 family metallo-hydrolase [Microcoleus sp. PH2017_21_R